MCNKGREGSVCFSAFGQKKLQKKELCLNDPASKNKKRKRSSNFAQNVRRTCVYVRNDEMRKKLQS